MRDHVNGNSMPSPAVNLSEPYVNRVADNTFFPADDMAPQQATPRSEDMPFNRLAWPWLHETYFLDVFNDVDFDWNTFGTYWEGPRAADSEAQSCATRSAFEPVSEHSGHPDLDLTSGINFISADQGISSERTDAVSIQSIAESLVKIATGAAFSHDKDDFSRDKWLCLTNKLSETLVVDQDESETVPRPPGWILQYFARQFLDHFNPLWPMFSKWRWGEQAFHPILLLTISSIGAMYGSPKDRSFGTSMHERLRRLLAAGLFDLEGPDDDLIWLAQARVLTQVHALYFGQRQGFSYAQVCLHSDHKMKHISRRSIASGSDPGRTGSSHESL